MKKITYIMRGVPGSGKSTIALSLAYGKEEIYDSCGKVVSADDFFMRNGKYEYSPKDIGTAHSYCKANFLIAAKEGVTPIVVDNTNIKRADFEWYERTAAAEGYEVIIVEVKTRLTPEQLAERNTHGVPALKIASMMQNFEP